MKQGTLKASELVDLIKKQTVCIGRFEVCYPGTGDVLLVDVPRAGRAKLTIDEFLQMFGDDPIPYHTKF